jgi:hypothetical protein
LNNLGASGVGTGRALRGKKCAQILLLYGVARRVFWQKLRGGYTFFRCWQRISAHCQSCLYSSYPS